MTTEQLFSYANLFALLGWLALLAAPLRREPLVLVARVVAAVLAGLYTTLFVVSLSGGGAGGMPEMTATGLATAFSRPEVLLVGWVHYLAFDLWVGAWITHDAGERRINHLLVIPCLILCFLTGPIGLLLYLVVRVARGRPRRTLNG